jgi:hypothetical protein
MMHVVQSLLKYEFDEVPVNAVSGYSISCRIREITFFWHLLLYSDDECSLNTNLYVCYALLLSCVFIKASLHSIYTEPLNYKNLV